MADSLLRSVAHFANHVGQVILIGKLFLERRQEAPEESESASFRCLYELVGIPVDTMRGWVGRAGIDSGIKPGMATSENKEIERLRKENAGLKRADEILRTVSADSTAQCNSASSLPARVSRSRVYGAWRSTSGLYSSSSSWVKFFNLFPPAKYWHRRPLVFSLLPQCERKLFTKTRAVPPDSSLCVTGIVRYGLEGEGLCQRDCHVTRSTLRH